MVIRVLIILFAITSTPVFAIINGKAADHTKNSFFVQIMDVKRTEQNEIYAMHVCGGSILNQQYIITAAHCVDEPSDYITKYVSIGEPSKIKYSTESLKEIEEIHVFEKYGTEITENKTYTVQDLAILKLKNPITENVASVNLSNDSYIHSYYTRAIAMGMGRIESPNPRKYLYGASSEYLRQTDIELMHIEMCEHFKVPKSLLCSQHNFKDTGIIQTTAEGDSGSPIMIHNKETNEYYQVGIISSHDVDYNREWSMSYFQNITIPDSISFISRFENLAEKTKYNPEDKNYYLKSEYKDVDSLFAVYDEKVVEYNKIVKVKQEEYYASDQYKYDLAIFILKIIINIILMILVVVFGMLAFKHLFYITDCEEEQSY